MYNLKCGRSYYRITKQKFKKRNHSQRKAEAEKRRNMKVILCYKATTRTRKR